MPGLDAIECMLYGFEPGDGYTWLEEFPSLLGDHCLQWKIFVGSMAASGCLEVLPIGLLLKSRASNTVKRCSVPGDK